MNAILLDALESCLKRIEQGETPDSALTRYPELAAQLRPLLETAFRARAARVEDLPLTALELQRSRGLALASDLRKTTHPQQRRIWRPVMTVLSVIAILVMSSNGLLIASAHSIPGDTLYPLKRSVESTQLRLVSDPAEREALERTFDERRVDETRSLISDQRVESVEFTGVVSSQSENEWLVSGIHVVITSTTRIDAGIEVGDEIDVDGDTNTAGAVDATRLTLVKSSATQPAPPEVTPTPTPSPESSGESSLEETPDGSSITPGGSGEGENQEGDGTDQSSQKSHEDRHSDETDHSSQPNSRSGGD